MYLIKHFIYLYIFTDGVSSTGYQDVSITSRDNMYTGRDPGGGVKDPGASGDMGGATSKDTPHYVPNPPDRTRPQQGIRTGHQRQYSDSNTAVDLELGASKNNNLNK